MSTCTIKHREKDLSLFFAGPPSYKHQYSRGAAGGENWKFTNMTRVSLDGTPQRKAKTFSQTRTFSYRGGYFARSGLVTAHTGFPTDDSPFFASYSPSEYTLGGDMKVWSMNPETGHCTYTEMMLTKAEHKKCDPHEGEGSLAKQILAQQNVPIHLGSGPGRLLTFSVGDLGNGGSSDRTITIEEVDGCGLVTEVESFNYTDSPVRGLLL